MDAQALGLAAKALAQAEGTLEVIKALLDDLVHRELLTPEKRDAMLAKATGE